MGNGYGSELDARRACLPAVMTYAHDLGATRVVFEQDDSLWRWDNSTARGDHPGLSAAEPRCKYGHHRAGAEELLALPDAIAWLGEFRGRTTWANVIG